MIQIQAWIRWYIAQKNYLLKEKELTAIKVIQDLIRNNIKLTTWSWYKLWVKVHELIPIVNDQRLLKEIKEKNLELEKV